MPSLTEHADEVTREAPFKKQIWAALFGQQQFHNRCVEQDVKGVADNHQNILSRLDAAGIPTFAQSTLYTALLASNINAKVKQLNRLIRVVCEGEKLCKFVDLNASLAPDGYLLYPADALHLSAEAYPVWGNQIAPYLAEE